MSLPALQASGQGREQAKANVAQTIRVYDVSDIVQQQSQMIGDWLTGENDAQVSGLGNSATGGFGGSAGMPGTGGGGMGGGMGGVPGGGGGFFSVPSHIQPQFGGFGGESDQKDTQQDGGNTDRDVDVE
ncbi:MAG: hypothetical protein R3C05_11255 [Pirellulaceae bacterium]